MVAYLGDNWSVLNVWGRRCGKHPGPWQEPGLEVPAMSILSNHHVEVLDELNGVQPIPQPEPACQPKAARTIRLLLPLHGSNPGVVRIQVGRQAADYFVRRIGSDFGDGFEVEK